jgi:hypothetical protein
VIRKVAKARDAFLVDLEGRLGTTGIQHPSYTDNGMHLSESGYRLLASEILAHFGLSYHSREELGRGGLGINFSKLEPLRKAVVAKNELFFHRWRPENETYIFGFRKKEQGQNAVEIPRFDPLIAAKEAEINRLKKN